MTSRYPRSAPRRQGLESVPFVVLCQCWSSLRLLSLSPNLHWCKGFYFIGFVFVFWCIAIDSKAHTLPKASKTHAYIAHRNQISTCEQTHTHINTSNETRFSLKQEHLFILMVPISFALYIFSMLSFPFSSSVCLMV